MPSRLTLEIRKEPKEIQLSLSVRQAELIKEAVIALASKYSLESEDSNEADFERLYQADSQIGNQLVKAARAAQERRS